MQCYTESQQKGGVVYYGYGKTGHDQNAPRRPRIPARMRLRSLTAARFSLIATDGTPYAVALNVVRDGKKLFFHSAPEGLKVDSLRENPQVCLLFVKTRRSTKRG